MDYEKLYNSYYMQVYSYAVTLARSRDLAEEITQQFQYTDGGRTSAGM